MTDSGLRFALPNKGRLKDPSVRILRDAGLSFELTERALSVPVRNVDIELLLVRTEDVPELVSDGVADLGITGVDLLVERANGIEPMLELGFGHCSLVAAVPTDSPVHKTDDFDGLRVATAHPNATRSYFEERAISVDIVALRGSVEVAPKIGVADAIVDLVSTGSTMRVNGLRQVGTLLRSQATLVARPERLADPLVRQVETTFRAVLAGRRKRYLLLNAPTSALDGITQIIPGLEAPTVIPLAEEGWVAVHSVVDAEHLWEVLPRLEEAGGKGILVLPIEQML